MKKYIIPFLLLMLGHISIQANIITVDNIVIRTGESCSASIALENSSDNLVGFQMDITLPEGISINNDECQLSGRIQDQDQQLIIGELGNNTYRLTTTSLSLHPITDNSGEIISLSLGANDMTDGGKVTIGNIRFVTSQSERIYLSEAEFTIQIVDITPAIAFDDNTVKSLCLSKWDVNSDGEISMREAAKVTDLESLFQGNTTITSFYELKYFTGLTSIAENAFQGCSGLLSVSIPENVQQIGSYSFNGCNNLKSVYAYMKTPPSIAETTFSSQGVATLFVTRNYQSGYTNAEVWKNFYNIIAMVFNHGDGTEENPYLLYNPSDFLNLANDVNAGTSYEGVFFKVAKPEIDFSGVTYIPIGKSKSLSFSGTFDGQNTIIKGLSFYQSSGYSGIFGYVSNKGHVSNIIIDESCNFQGLYDLGGIVGANEGLISNCINKGAVSSSKYRVGGICGDNMGVIENCTNCGTIQTSNTDAGFLGGIAGDCDKGVIRNCTNYGKISGPKAMQIGGIVGLIVTNTQNRESIIEGCTNKGDVEGDWDIGGIAGDLGGTYHFIRNCLVSACTIKATQTGGAIIGSAGGTLSENYYTSDVVVIEGSVTYDGLKARGIPGNKNITKDNGAMIQYDINALFDYNAEGYYEIKSVKDMVTLRDLVNELDLSCEGMTFKVTAKELNFDYQSLTLGTCIPSSYYYNGVSYDKTYKPFSGTFDGNGVLIKRLLINNNNNEIKNGFGLFAYNKGTIKNIVLDESCTIQSAAYAPLGGIVAVNEGVIEGCTNKATINGMSEIGGIAGINRETIQNCTNTGVINGNGTIGGITGNNNGTIIGCANSGDITGPSQSSSYTYNKTKTIAGIAGNNTGTLSDNIVIGGVFSNASGFVVGTNTGTLQNNLYSSNVTGETGINYSGSYDGDISTNYGAVKGTAILAGENVKIVNATSENGGLIFYNNIPYAYEGLTINLTLEYEGEVPANYDVEYWISGYQIVKNEGGTYPVYVSYYDRTIDATLVEKPAPSFTIPESTIIPWGTEQAWEMKYAYFDEIGNTPANDGAGRAWTDAKFDDSSWSTLRGPIARYESDFSVVNTIWEKENSCYYLRRTFNLDKVNEQGYYFCSQHDDNIKVWINGTQVVEAGYNGRCQYYHIPASAFVEGTNTLAIYLDDTGGGANLDYCMANFYLLKNVETGKYLNAGDEWRAVLADEGLPVKLNKQSDGSYTIYFPFGSRNQQLLYRTGEEGVYVDYSRDWAPYGACPSWTFTDAGEGRIYIQTLTTHPTYGQEAMPDTYMGNNPSSNFVDGNITVGNNITWTVEALPARTEAQTARLQELVTAAKGLGLDTSEAEAVLNNNEATYINMQETILELQNRINDEHNNINAKAQDLNKLIACASAIGVSTSDAQAVADNPQDMESVKNAISTLHTAYIDKLGEGVDNSLLPLDVTGVIINPSFAINEADGWSWKDGEDGPGLGSTTAEYRERTFDFHQSVSGLPNGSYLLKVKGFHRPGNKDDVFADYMQGTDNAKAQLYANGKSVTLKNVAAEAQETAVDGWSGLDVTYNGQTRFIPHENYDADTWFLAGYYENELPFTVTDGTLTLGISLDESVKDDWVVFDDFRLLLRDNGLIIAEKDWSGVTDEELPWIQFAGDDESGYNGSATGCADGIAITVDTKGEFWQPQANVLEGVTLQKNHSYKVVFTAKIPADGSLQANIGSWEENNQYAIPITASNDFQDIEFIFEAFPDNTEGGRVLFQNGDILGTSILKHVKIIDLGIISAGDATDVSQLANAVYTEAQSGNVGRPFTIDIKLKNENSVRAYSFDLQLPEGITIAKNGEDDYEIELSGRHDSYTPTVNYDESTNTYKLATTSRVVGNDGVIMTLRLQVSDQMPMGESIIRILNANYTQAENYQDIHMPETFAKLTIGEKTYTKGDVNDDDDVDIADVVCVVNHVVGIETPRYFETAADVTGDNEVTISDAAKLIDYIIGEIETLDPAAARSLARVRASSNHVSKTRSIDPSTLNDALYAGDLTVTPGSESTLTISLKNALVTNGYSFDLILPDGVTLAKEGNDKYICMLSSRHDKSHEVHINYKEATRTYSVAVYSQSSKELSDNDGDVLTFTLAVTDAMPYAGATATIQNAKYSKTDGSGKVTLPREEVRLSRNTTKSDVMKAMSYILGENPEDFNVTAADMNGDGEVTIADVLIMLDTITKQ